MKLTPYATNLLLSYIILQDILGARLFRWFDSKGGEIWIKAWYFLKEEKYIPKGEKCLSESSQLMREK